MQLFYTYLIHIITYIIATYVGFNLVLNNSTAEVWPFKAAHIKAVLQLQLVASTLALNWVIKSSTMLAEPF